MKEYDNRDMASDEVLMLRFQSGDRKAFEDLFRKYSKQIVNYIYRFFGNQSIAEEIAQEVFLRVYKSKGYKAEAKFSTWLYRIATNISLNELRRGEYKLRLESMDKDDDGYGLESAKESDKRELSPDKALEEKEFEMRVIGILDALPEKQRVAFILNRFEAHSYEEIAKVLGCSLGAVKSLIFRASETIKEGIKPFIEE